MAFFIAVPYAAAQPPASQTIGGVIRQEIDQEKKEGIEERATATHPLPAQVNIREDVSLPEGTRVPVREIRLEGVSLLTEKESRKIVVEFEGRELSLRDMQRLADTITQRYRQKGYITSRAFIPPQTIKDGILVIRVVEGKLGELEIKGNRYFRTSLLEKGLGIHSGGSFDYSALQKGLVYINEHPDRTARTILVPGKRPGTTDIIIEVEDNFPLHAGFEYDNYGSRYIENNRFSFVAEHNNLTGHDDKFYLKIQNSEGFRLQLQQGRYIYPLSRTLNVGGFFLFSQLDSGKEFEALDSEGSAQVFGLFLNKILKQETDIDWRLNAGFDYKDLRNDLLGDEISHDKLRVIKLGMDLDVNDQWGRSIFSVMLDTGLADFWGSMEAKDDDASRVGAGGSFTKTSFYFFRLQPLPFASALLWKNIAQYSHYNLVAAEQFQIGGATSVRGYPPAEFSGDRGYYTALEWSFPVYGLSQKVKVPFWEAKLYDALRLVLFYDWAFVHSKTVAAGENENETLKGAGFGVRLNVGRDLTCRIEVGYPMGRKPSDGDNIHPWVEFTWKF